MCVLYLDVKCGSLFLINHVSMHFTMVQGETETVFSSTITTGSQTQTGCSLLVTEGSERRELFVQSPALREEELDLMTLLTIVISLETDLHHLHHDNNNHTQTFAVSF